MSARLGRTSLAMSPSSTVEGGAAKDCRLLRLFFPPRCLRFLAGPCDASAWCEPAGFMVGAGGDEVGAPPGVRLGGVGRVVRCYIYYTMNFGAVIAGLSSAGHRRRAREGVVENRRLQVCEKSSKPSDVNLRDRARLRLGWAKPL